MTSHMPIATWRAQCTPRSAGTRGWRFEDAAMLAEFLKHLGISDLYASPILEARAGSTHGYDVTDPSRIRGELGSAEGFEALAARLRKHNLGIILDIVPNHMAADPGNPWWWDVLAHGPRSQYANHFDIDWEAGGGKLILPVLGKTLDEAVNAGELSVGPRSEHDDTLTVHYFDKRFPLAQHTLAANQNISHKPSPAELRAILDQQHYRLEFWRTGLRTLNYRRFFDIADLVSIRAEDPPVFDDSHRLILYLLQQGHIRGLRIDHIDGLYNPREYLSRLRERMTKVSPAPSTPYLIVEKILAHDEQLPADWPVDGTSGYEFLSHINTLFIDPTGAAQIEADAHQRLSAAPAFAAEARNSKRFAIRELFDAETNRLTATLAKLAELTGDTLSTDNLREALIETTASMSVYRTYITPDHPEPSPEDTRRLTEALDTAAAYATDSRAAWSRELAFLRTILLNPASSRPDRTPDFESLRTQFLLRYQQFTGPAMAKGVEDTALYRRITLASLNDVGCDPDDLPADPALAFHTFCADRQIHSRRSLSTTSTHDTKRGEDTRLRISALSTIAPDYLAALDRWFDWHSPIRALLPGGPAPRPTDEALIYQSLLAIWPTAGSTDQQPAMSTMSQIATRLSEYLIKAAREAKLRTNWHEPDEQYEEALRRFITALATGPQGQQFREDSRTIRKHMALAGALASLSQVLIKTAAPGIPDFYRGTELWDLSLVDPDNRRPVDFELRLSTLRQLQTACNQSPERHMQLLAEIVEPDGPLGWRGDDSSESGGAIKMYTMMRALAVRNQNAELFDHGDYIPLNISGSRASQLFAFARVHNSQWILTIAPRLMTPDSVQGSSALPLGTAWQDVAILLPPDAPTHWRSAMLPQTAPAISAQPGTCDPPHLAVADALRHFPVALLLPA